MAGRCIGGIVGEDGKVRAPQGEVERCRHAIFTELVDQQIANGAEPLIRYVADGAGIIVGVDIEKLMAAIWNELN